MPGLRFPAHGRWNRHLAVNLLEIPTWTAGGALHAVVETPRGSSAKLKYEPDLGAFVLERPLAAGIRYPFDWGFFPGTLAADGDPLDVMILHDTATHPGLVIRCDALAVLRVTQNRKSGRGRERNDRVIAAPRGEAFASRALLLGQRLRRELEQFFRSAVLLEKKDVRFTGWGRAWEAEAIVRKAQRKFETQGE